MGLLATGCATTSSRFERGEVLLRDGNAADAEPLLADAAARRPDRFEYVFALGLAREALGNGPGAERSW